MTPDRPPDWISTDRRKTELTIENCSKVTIRVSQDGPGWCPLIEVWWEPTVVVEHWKMPVIQVDRKKQEGNERGEQ